MQQDETRFCGRTIDAIVDLPCSQHCDGDDVNPRLAPQAAAQHPRLPPAEPVAEIEPCCLQIHSLGYQRRTLIGIQVQSVEAPAHAAPLQSHKSAFPIPYILLRQT